MQEFISLSDSCFERQNLSFSSGFNKIITSTLKNKILFSLIKAVLLTFYTTFKFLSNKRTYTVIYIFTSLEYCLNTRKIKHKCHQIDASLFVTDNFEKNNYIYFLIIYFYNQYINNIKNFCKRIFVA